MSLDEGMSRTRGTPSADRGCRALHSMGREARAARAGGGFGEDCRMRVEWYSYTPPGIERPLPDRWKGSCPKRGI